VTAPLVDSCDTLVGDCARCRPLVLASDQSGLMAIAIAGGYVYWSNTADNVGIFRAPRNGGSTESVAPGQMATYLVTDGSYVYWFRRGSQNGGVYRVAASGGATMMVAADSESGIIGGPDIAVDDTYVYWPVQQASRAVKRALKQGGVAETFASSVSGPVLGVVADQGTVYWIEQDSGSIMQASASGGEPSVLVASNAYSGLSLDGDYVYWSSASDGEIIRARRSGGTPQTLVTGQNRPFATVADAAYVYWASLADGSIAKAPLGGGESVVIDQGSGGAGWLASDKTSLCWTGMDRSDNAGTIMCLEK